jgi:hypothetical protein
MHRGWTKRWRKRWDKGYHQNFLLWIMMDYFIDFAAYEPKDLYLKGHGIVHLERGEWAFTQRELAIFLNVGRQQIRDQLELLKKMDFLTQDITQSKTQHITKINIINYDTYQDTEEIYNPTKNPDKNQALTQLQPNSPQTSFNTKNKRKENRGNGIPDWIPKQIWSDFREFRTRKKAPLTDRASKAIIKKLDLFRSQGQNPEAILEQSIVKGWTDVWPIKSDSLFNEPLMPRN